MADISKIKLPNETTYDLVDKTKLPLAGGTMTGQIVLASNGYRTNNAAGYSVDQHGNFTHLGTTTSDYWHLNSNNGTSKFSVYWETGNVTAAGTVTASRFIGINEADLKWGGKNFSSDFGCIDAALMDELRANRFQFIKASAITVEYTRDGGTTWTDYGATDTQKQQIFAQGGGLIIGKADSTNKATEHPGLYQLRITIDTGVANVYSYLNKFIIYVSSGGSANCTCKIQKALQSTPTAFVDHTDWISVGGWSGYNVLNTSALPTYGNSPSGQYGRVRFIFKDGEGGNTNYIGLSVLQIKAFGGVGWSTPSTMAKTGHLYSYDQDQNATFPGNITAPKFIGSLQGNADTATSATSATSATTASKLGSSNVGSATQPIYLASGTPTACTYTLGKSVPSDAVFTDTNNAVTQTATDSTNATYELLFSSTADNTTRTEGARKTQNLTYNPSTRTLKLQYPTTEGNSGTFIIQSNSNNILGLYSGYNSGMTGVYAKNGIAGNTWIELIAGTDDLKIQSTDLAFQDSTNTWDGTNKSLKTAVTNAKSKVKQENTTTDASYRLLLSHDANDTTTDNVTTQKSTYLQFNPNKSALTVGTRASGTVGSYSSTFGADNVAAGQYSHVEGKGCSTASTAWYQHAEGQGCAANGDASHAEGCSTQASGSYSHAEGHSTKALSNYSHAEGYGCEASTGAWYQHAEGQETKAGGNAGHAEGCATVTAAHYSHAEGLGTYAGSQAQHVFGKYNTKDTSGTYVEIVGKGTSDADADRADARTLDWNGNEWLLGSLTTTDVIKTAKWDGTNTSLQTTITTIRNSLPTSTTNNGWYITKFPNIKFAICRYVSTTKHTGGTKSYSTASSPITFKNATVSVSAMVAGRTDTNVQYTNVSTNGVEAYVSCGVTSATNTRVTFTVFTDYD